MLSAAQYQPRLCAPDSFTSACTQPLLATFSHELRRLHGSWVRSATKPCYWNSPLVAHSIIDSHASVWIRNILYRPTNVHYASVVVAHKPLVFNTPARKIRRQRVVPEIYRRLNKIVSEHAAADDSLVVMIELNSREANAWANPAEYSGRR